MASSATVLAVGRVRRPHGVHGEVVVEIHTDFPERLQPGIEVGIGADGPSRWLRVHKVRLHKGCWLLAFEGLLTREGVDDLRDAWVYLPSLERASLPEHYYYEHELEGLRCVDRDGRDLGRVNALVPGAGSALLELATPTGNALVPFVSPIVVGVDLEGGTITLDPPGGLLDGNAL